MTNLITIGGKSNILSLGYIIAGGICLLMGILLGIFDHHKEHK